MMELFLVKTTEMLEIPTESVTWSGQRFHAARKIDAKIFYTNRGLHHSTKVEEGDTILFKWKGKEVFRGTVFSKSRTKSGLISIVAYDMLQYMLLNKDVYVFSNKRVDEMLIRMCKDFQIPYSTIANTNYSIKSSVFKNETTLYDIALKGILDTEKQTNRKYQIRSQKGKIELIEWSTPNSAWVLETGVNITDYTYSTSIEETATKVKLVSGEENNTISAVVTDTEGQKQYGVLQYFEKVTDELNKAQLTDRARKTLDKKKGVKKELMLDSLGISEVISGVPVYVIENEIPIKQTYFVDTDTHYFYGNMHNMTLKLIERNSSPDEAMIS
jgi:hypothetical protein